MKSLTTIMAVLFALTIASCSHRAEPAVGQACEPNLYPLNYCPSDSLMEGNWDVYAWASWYNCQCKEPAEECCEKVVFPSVEYSRLRKMEGFLNFTPHTSDRGVLVGDVFGTNSSVPGVAVHLPYIGKGTYNMLWDENNRAYFAFHSIDYDREYRIVIRYLYEGEARLQFQAPDGTPKIDIQLVEAGMATDCSYDETAYEPNYDYGYCYASETCHRFLASCVTEHSCSEILESEGLESGSWRSMKDVDTCRQVEAPDRPLYD